MPSPASAFLAQCQRTWIASDAAADADRALTDITIELQQSALVLVEAMIAITDDDLAEAA